MAESSLPSRFGPYRITARIGRGAMGVVYSAVDEILNRPVALKVLIADLESEPESRERFYREARAAARLIHPNIITVYDAGEDQGRSYIAMQLLEGAPLATYLKRPDAAPLERKLDLMIQVCEGLIAAHGEGIIHRDLKPSNLFVQSDGLLKILDFGVARFTDSSMTIKGTMLGTPDYMSPEQARGDSIDARSDIFSAGAVFYFMLAGKKPFPGPDLPALLRQLQLEEPAPLRGVPLELATLVSQAMAKRADHRPNRVEELLGELVQFRRQYLADTRRRVFSLRTEFEELEKLAASVADAGATLGVADRTAADGLERIREQYPFLDTRRMSLESLPDERQAFDAVSQTLRGVREDMDHTLEVWLSCAARLQDGEKLLSSGDAVNALVTFESVLQTLPESTKASELVTACGPAAMEQQVRRRRVAELHASALSALQTAKPDEALEYCDEALALEPHDETIESLRGQAARAVEHEQRRIAFAVDQLIDRASAAIATEAFDDADRALNEAEALRPGLPSIVNARRRLADARATAAAAELLHRLSTDEIRRARSAFRRGRQDEALRQLECFLEVEPNAVEVSHEIVHLRGLLERMQRAQATAGAEVSSAIETAVAARDSGAYDTARAALCRALQLDPTNGAVVELLADLSARQLDARIAEERRRMQEQCLADAEPLVTAARTAWDRGYIDLALRTALAARRLAPDVPAIVEIADKLRDELNSEDKETFGLVSLPVDTPAPSSTAASRERESSNVFDWAIDMFRTSLRRIKA